MKAFVNFLQTSRRLVTVVALLVVTFCFAMFQGGFVSWFVFFTVTPFLLYSLLLAFVPLRISEIRRDIAPSKVERGDKVEITVTFRNDSWFPFVYLTVYELPMDEKFYQYAEGYSSRLFLVGFRKQFQWTYDLHDLQRGEHCFRGLEFVFADFFGWTIRKKVIERRQAFIVYPKTTAMKSASVRMQYDQGALASLYSIVKDTSMATGVRDYQPGDRFSWIHWKSFAKNGSLRTKEFEDRQSQSLFICMDRSEQPDFEQTVDLTASMLKAIVKQRGDVSFLSAGEYRFFYPNIRTESQLEKVMQHLAVVECDTVHSIETIIQPEQKMISRSVLIIVTSELKESLSMLLMNGSKYTRAIICFVIVSGEALLQHQEIRAYAGNNKVVYVTKEMFHQAFSEVNKP
ncbi:DUF58 domain-containing protein [Solibacillus sp. FSL H8-0538]|uniref:DUF58 domain-containing protein n=1 Tax=Solibacillus sp. FSL H8-0538 TaxID=2921400 RepID=UPI0030F95019